MLLHDLFEGPYHHDQNWVPTGVKPETPSIEGLERENYLLGTLEISGERYWFWLNHSKLSACVTFESVTYHPRHEVAVTLRFDPRASLPVNNELHVSSVYNRQEFRGKNLAMALYVLLARYKYTIVSDFVQYNGGKALWKQLASESSVRQFVVRIWSDETEDWLRDSSGDVVKYRGDNIPDSEIWHKDTTQSTTLLVLSSE